MSLQYIVSEPIIDTGFYSLDSNNNVNSPLGDLGEVLTLRAVPGNPRFWRAGFENIPAGGVDALYNHNAMLKLRTANYYTQDNMFIDGFVYTPPSWINISSTNKAFTISATGYYLISMTFVTTTVNATANFELILNNVVVPQSLISFTPSNVDIDGELEKITCTTSFLIDQLPVGANIFSIKIIPLNDINIQGVESFISIQQLTNSNASP